MVQELYKSLGENGCYLLCLYDVASEYIRGLRFPDYIDLHYFITKGWLESDMFVNDSEAILEHLTGVAWNVEKRYFPLEDNKKHYVIKCYCYNRFTHFCRDTFDSLDKSNCKENGVCNSLRVCTPVKNKIIKEENHVS